MSSDSSRRLIILTNAFPYGNAEPFLTAELPFLAREFDQITLVATQAPAKTIHRLVPQNIELWRVDVPRSLPKRLASIVRGATRAVRGGDLGRLFDGLPRPATFRNGFTFESRAQWCFEQIKPRIRALNIDQQDEVVIYSFWFHHTARVAELMADYVRSHTPSSVVSLVTRAHGYDLYESAHPLGWLPQREAMLRAFDGVHPVSTQGQNHLHEAYPEFSSRVSVRHLGSPEPHSEPTRSRERFFISSCAFVTDVKRLHRIPMIIEEIASRGIDIVWTHAGDGPGLAALRKLVQETNHRADVNLMGHVDDIFEHYRRHPSTLFLSLSASEGIPVSMMEAISCGIPVISTDVGGVRDLVVPDVSGALVPADPTDQEVVDSLLRIWALGDEEYQGLCDSSRAFWKSHFSTETAYGEFSKELGQRLGLPGDERTEE